jgi:hypothetical protein
VVTLRSPYTRALTFENVLLGGRLEHSRVSLPSAPDRLLHRPSLQGPISLIRFCVFVYTKGRRAGGREIQERRGGMERTRERERDRKRVCVSEYDTALHEQHTSNTLATH